MLQCTTNYPSDFKNVGLNVITDMKKRFNCYIGLSDHTGSVFPSIAALSLGAEIIEIHVCISRKHKGVDINSSVTFEELKTICKARDSIYKMRKNPVNKNILSNIQKKITIFISLFIIFSYFFSFITIKYFLRYIKNFSLNIFVIYRIFLGICILVIAYL